MGIICKITTKYETIVKTVLYIATYDKNNVVVNRIECVDKETYDSVQVGKKYKLVFEPIETPVQPPEGQPTSAETDKTQHRSNRRHRNLCCRSTKVRTIPNP